MEVFELPPRRKIESIARQVYDLLTARNRKPPSETPAARLARVRQADEAYYAAAREASRILLGPAAARIGNKRLLIVGEGMLRYLPFGAWREPGANTPLMVKHEMVTAPSASVVGVLRQGTTGRKPATKPLAVFADPVFQSDDARVAPLHNIAVRSDFE